MLGMIITFSHGCTHAERKTTLYIHIYIPSFCRFFGPHQGAGVLVNDYLHTDLQSQSWLFLPLPNFLQFLKVLFQCPQNIMI